MSFIDVGWLWVARDGIHVQKPTSFIADVYPRTEAGYRALLEDHGYCRVVQPPASEDEGDVFLRDLVARNIR